MSKGFFGEARKIMRGLDQTQVDSINGIMQACHDQGVTDPVLQGYILGTAWHESKLRPVREGFKKTDAAARAYVKRHYGTRYGKPAGPYGHVYYGRGFVQLTWLENYRNSSKDAGVDLVKYPDKVLDPGIAARLIVAGMMDGRWNGKRKGLATYLGKKPLDYKNARRTVNITDKWQLIAGYAKRFTAALQEHGFDLPSAKPSPKPQVNVAAKSDASITIPKTTTGEKGGAVAGAVVAVGGGLAAAWHNGLWVLLSVLGIGAIAFIAYRIIKRK